MVQDMATTLSPPSSPAVDPKRLRNAFGTFATGVTIVTTQDGAGHDIGLTVNSFSSVSLDPPMVLWSLGNGANSRDAFLQNPNFAVHILADDQAELSALFGTRGADKFAGITVERGHGNLPLLPGCAARFECKTVYRYSGGDHDILVGEVVSFENFEKSALVFLSGKYAVAVEHVVEPKPTPDEDPYEAGMTTSLQYLLARAFYQCQLGVRPELAKLELSEAEYFVLGGCAFHAPCTVQKIFDLVAVSGYRLDLSNIKRLAQRKLIALDEEDITKATVHLTDGGREILTRVAVLNKSIENDAVKNLDRVEIQVLKQMLNKVIHSTLPSWRRPI